MHGVTKSMNTPAIGIAYFKSEKAVEPENHRDDDRKRAASTRSRTFAATAGLPLLHYVDLASEYQ